jgi:hypothetical protein
MSEVRYVTVTIQKPGKKFPLGQVCDGCYTLVDGVVTMTDRDGRPAEDTNGKKYTHTLKPGEDARVVAGRMTKELRLALRGKNAPVAGFEGKIPYRKSGLA